MAVAMVTGSYLLCWPILLTDFFDTFSKWPDVIEINNSTTMKHYNIRMFVIHGLPEQLAIYVVSDNIVNAENNADG